MDGVVSPATAIAIGRLGGAGVLHLEGVWTRLDDPESALEELATLDDEAATSKLREIYATPIRPDLIATRIGEIRDAGVLACAAVTPHRTEELMPAIRESELDLLLIQSPVLSAEHVSTRDEPLNLKTYIRQLDIPVVVGGCASYQAALHLMRTGAAGVMVGVGAGATGTVGEVLGIGMPQATAIADARAARMRHLDETGVYVHVIADGGMATGGDIAKAIVCGADAVMVGAPLAAAAEAPGRGFHWGMAASHTTLPRGTRISTPARGTLEEILVGPAVGEDGRTNLLGGLRTSMASCGYENLKEFQKADLVVVPAADHA
jgi:IMP dehydrogenase